VKLARRGVWAPLWGSLADSVEVWVEKLARRGVWAPLWGSPC